MSAVVEELGDRGFDIVPSFNLGLNVFLAKIEEKMPKDDEQTDVADVMADQLAELTMHEQSMEELRRQREIDLANVKTEEDRAIFDNKYNALIQQVDDKFRYDKSIISLEFLEEDPVFQKAVADGGSNPSASVNTWARNRLTKFREWKKMANLNVPFEELQPAEMSNLLTKFFEQIKKKDGSLYPTQTLMSLFRAFHRLLRRAQETRIQASGIEEAPFSMRQSTIFKQVCVSCVLAMERSRKAGANVQRKKSEVINLSDKAAILVHIATNPSFPRGLQRRALYYLLCYFGMRGGQELYNLTADEIEFGVDEAGPYIRYNERLSKNYKVSLDRYQDEHFRDAVASHNSDFIQTIKSLVDRLSPGSRHIFCQCIDSPSKHQWYSSLRIAARKLANGMRDIYQECGLGIEGKGNVTNKSGRTTCVTRMAAEGVPPEIGMRVTGHKSQSAYSRYDRSLEAQVRAAHKCVEEGKAYAVNIEEQTELWKEKVLKGEAMEVEDEASPPKRVKIQPAESEAASNVEPEGRKMEEVEAPMLPKEDTTSEVVDSNDDSWMDDFNWENYMAPWDRGTVNVNPITAVFNKIQSLSNCTVNINIGSLTAP